MKLIKRDKLWREVAIDSTQFEPVQSKEKEEEESRSFQLIDEALEGGKREWLLKNPLALVLPLSLSSSQSTNSVS